jgi:hypothetical protein
MLPGSVNVSKRKHRADEALIVRLKLSDDEFGEWSEREAVYALEDRLIELFASRSFGEFDGHEFGGGFATLFMYGPSAERMAEAVLSVLDGVAVLRGSVITKRFGASGSREETTSLGEGAA